MSGTLVELPHFHPTTGSNSPFIAPRLQRQSCRLEQEQKHGDTNRSVKPNASPLFLRDGDWKHWHCGGKGRRIAQWYLAPESRQCCSAITCANEQSRRGGGNPFSFSLFCAMASDFAEEKLQIDRWMIIPPPAPRGTGFAEDN